jgi:hypothetical protein
MGPGLSSFTKPRPLRTLKLLWPIFPHSTSTPGEWTRVHSRVNFFFCSFRSLRLCVFGCAWHLSRFGFNFHFVKIHTYLHMHVDVHVLVGRALQGYYRFST